MKRTPSLCLIALVGLSACDGGNADSLLGPEPPDLSLGKVQLPAFEPPTECPVAFCIAKPTLLVREANEPTRVSLDFAGEEGQEAELVVIASNPKATTAEAWLNGTKVLLPSAMPRSGSNEVRVSLTLAEENTFLFQLSGQPGTRVAFWIESKKPGPTEPTDPVSTRSFWLATDAVGPTAVQSSSCAAHGDGFRIADWTDVVAALDAGTPKEKILASGSAWILWNGTGLVPGSFLVPDRHYELSTLGWNGTTGVSYGTEAFWLNLSSSDQRVLCVGPAA